MAPDSSTLVWQIPWAGEPGGLQSVGLLWIGHYWVTSLSLFTFIHWRRKWQPTPVFLPGESQGRGSLVGWSDLAAAAEQHDLSPLFAPPSSVLCFHTFSLPTTQTYSHDFSFLTSATTAYLSLHIPLSSKSMSQYPSLRFPEDNRILFSWIPVFARCHQLWLWWAEANT